MKVKKKNEFKLNFYEVLHKGNTYYYSFYNLLLGEDDKISLWDDSRDILLKLKLQSSILDSEGNLVHDNDLWEKITDSVFDFDHKKTMEKF